MWVPTKLVAGSLKMTASVIPTDLPSEEIDAILAEEKAERDRLAAIEAEK